MVTEKHWCHGCTALIRWWDEDGGLGEGCALHPDIDPDRVVKCEMRIVQEKVWEPEPQEKEKCCRKCGAKVAGVEV